MGAPASRRGGSLAAVMAAFAASMSAVDKRVKQEGHISRSALICALLANFLSSRPLPKQVAVTINVPIELWNRLGDAPEAAILRAIEESVTKELV